MIPLHQLNFFVVCIRYLLTIPGATADEDIALRYVYLVYRRQIHLQGQWEDPSSLAKQDNLFKYLDKDVAYISSLQLISVTQLCPTSCEPMDCSMPGFPVHYQLSQIAQTHVPQFTDASQPSHSLSSPSPKAFNLSQHQGLFQWVSSLHQVAKVLEFQLQHQSFQRIFRTYFL